VRSSRTLPGGAAKKINGKGGEDKETGYCLTWPRKNEKGHKAGHVITSEL